MNDHIIAVDLGGTQVRAALCDTSGHILNRTSQPADAAEGPDAVFARIVASTRTVAGDWARVRAIGVSAAGPLDPWRGVVLESPNLPGMIDFPMKARLEAEFHLPAFVGNDANLAALGEHRYGAGRGVAHMIYMTISTGIGGGIIADNELFLGWRGLAGEVGHQTLDVNGPQCNCGNIGCLEALAAGPAIERDAREALRAGRESTMRVLVSGDLDKITGATVAQAARAGDTLARDLLERAGYYIGLGMVNLLHNFDTQLFVLGGGVAINDWDFLYPQMIATLQKHAFPSMSRDVLIVPAQLGDDAGVLGAVALVLDCERQKS
jgi:glucokinase